VNQTSSNKLTDWLQIGANLGIIAGLLLVILQMNQSADLLETQLIYVESERQLNLETAVIGENAAAALMKASDDFETNAYIVNYENYH
jgi:hypothetical protein